jgi:lactoylglutathione lyase
MPLLGSASNGGLNYCRHRLTIAAVRATRINHVSIHADDMETSVRFYEDLFGVERLPTPNFGMPVQWLRLGGQQLHIFVRETGPPRYHHLALDVDDFEAVYRKAKELGVLDSTTHGSPVREHPSGWVQMYIRDPAGNLIEVDWPDAAGVDRSVVTDMSRLEDEAPQVGEEAEATLYHEAPAPA